MNYPLRKLRKPKRNRAKIWYEQAMFDTEAAKVSMDAGFHEWACYQSTQSAEKSLKALIIHSGYHHPRTHKLSVLIGILNNLNQKFRKTKFGYRELEVYTFIARYPFLIEDQKDSPHHYITESDSKKCYGQALHLLDIAADILKIPADEEYFDHVGIEKIDLEARLEQVKKQILSKFKPEKIIIFGSYARGEEKFSTLDVMIIMDTELSFVERLKKIREITKGGLPTVQPVVYTPEEFKKFTEEGSEFLENVMNEGKEIYTKPK